MSHPRAPHHCFKFLFIIQCTSIQIPLSNTYIHIQPKYRLQIYKNRIPVKHTHSQPKNILRLYKYIKTPQTHPPSQYILWVYKYKKNLSNTHSQHIILQTLYNSNTDGGQQYSDTIFQVLFWSLFVSIYAKLNVVLKCNSNIIL